MCIVEFVAVLMTCEDEPIVILTACVEPMVLAINSECMLCPQRHCYAACKDLP